jgi:hypothetical protein
MIGFAGLGIEEASDKAIANLDKSSELPAYDVISRWNQPVYGGRA